MYDPKGLEDLLRQDVPETHRQSVEQLKAFVSRLLQYGDKEALAHTDPLLHLMFMAFISVDPSTLNSFANAAAELTRLLHAMNIALSEKIQEEDEAALDEDNTCEDCSRSIPADRRRCIQCQRVIDFAIQQDVAAMFAHGLPFDDDN